MSRELEKDLIESMKQAVEIHRGQRKPARVTKFDPMDVRKLRESVKASQSEFAQMIGVGLRTVQNWEQGHRVPAGPARALLRVFQKAPKVVQDALA